MLGIPQAGEAIHNKADIGTVSVWMDSTPQTPNPNHSRLDSSSSTSSPTPGKSTLRRSVPFPASSPSASHPQTSSISATGYHGSGWSEDEQDEGRAKRELSVIEERDANSTLGDGDFEQSLGLSPKAIKGPMKSSISEDRPKWGTATAVSAKILDNEDLPTVNQGSESGTPSADDRRGLRGGSLDTDDGRGYAQET